MIIKNKYFLLMAEYNVISYTLIPDTFKIGPKYPSSFIFHYSFSCPLNKNQGKAWLRPLLGPDSYTISSLQNIFSPNLHMHQANQPNKQIEIGHREVGQLFLRSNAL